MRILFVLLLACIMPAAAAGQGFQTESARGRITFGFGPTFNRVEGLPVTVGPIIETIEPRPIRFRGVAIIRAEPDLATEVERVGFQAQMDKSLDTSSTMRVGIAGWSEVESIETRGLSNLESSLSGFVFHDDRRDYYESLGGAIYAVYAPSELPYRGSIEIRYEDHGGLAQSTPSSIFDARRLWREQPVIAGGRVFGAAISLSYDTRPDRRDGPMTGWLVAARVYRALGGDLVRPGMSDGVTNLLPVALEENFGTATLDLRRYNALGPVGFNLRLLGGGALDSDPLPAQFQFALGGDGTLPGHDLFALDCGAHATSVTPGPPLRQVLFHPFYGCDRYMLFQAEIEGYLGFSLGGDTPPTMPAGGINLGSIPQWVVFFNAAQAWTHQDGFFGAADEAMTYDVGGGVTLGDVGAYIGYPLDTDGANVKFVFRLQRRF